VNDLPSGLSGRLKDVRALVANSLHRVSGRGFVGRDLVVMRRLQRAGRVSFGRWTYGVPSIFTHMGDDPCLRVGNYSSIGSTFMLGGGHPVDRVTTYPLRIWMQMEGANEDGFPRKSGDTVIGSDVYAGWGALVMSGITIGDGAVIGAGAVVTKDVPPYAIVGGNPAKILRFRFSEDQIAALLEIRWWDWPDDEVRAAVPLLADKDVEAFIAYARDRSGTLATSAG